MSRNSPCSLQKRACLPPGAFALVLTLVLGSTSIGYAQPAAWKKAVARSLQKSEGEEPLHPVLQIHGHTEHVSAVAFSPDGKLVVTGSADSTLKLWHVRSGAFLKTFTGHQKRISKVAFCPSGTRIVSICDTATVIVWDLNGNQLLRIRVKEGDMCPDMAIDPTGQFVAVANRRKTADMFSLTSGKKIRCFKFPKAKKRWHSRAVAVDFSPDGKILVCGGPKGKVVAWNVENGSEVFKFTTLNDEHADVRVVEISPDGKLLLAGQDKPAVWSMETRKMMGSIEMEGSACSGTFSPDSRHVLSLDKLGNKMTMNYWSASTGKLLRTATASQEGLRTRAGISPDGKLFSVANLMYERGEGEVLKTLLEPLMQLESKVKTFQIKSIAIEPNGEKMAVTRGAFTHTGEKHTKEVQVWDLTTARLARILQLPEIEHETDQAREVTFSPNGQYLGAGSGNGLISVWDAKTGEYKFGNRPSAGSGVMASTHALHSLCFSPESDKILGMQSWDLYILSVSQGTVLNGRRVFSHTATFDVDNGDIFVCAGSVQRYTHDLYKKIYNGEKSTDAIRTIDASANGQYLATVGDEITGRIWDPKTGKKLRELGRHDHKFDEEHEKSCWGHMETCSAAEFSPDSRLVATAGRDRLAVIWDVKTGDPKHILRGHGDAIMTLQFGQDGRRLFTGSIDGTVRMWDTETGGLEATFAFIGEEGFGVFFADGYYTITTGDLSGVMFVKGREAYTFDSYDLVFNRPDIVIKRLGGASDKLIDAYRAAYLKRLRKMGFKEEDIKPDTHLPEVEILGDHPPSETNTAKIAVKVRLKDTKYALDRLNVYGNSVPVFGHRGLSVRQRNTKEVTETIAFELLPGDNRIQISAHNVNGLESPRVTFDIKRTDKSLVPVLYVLSIGVNSYKDSRFNLDYAAKDAVDISEIFKENTSLYFTVRTKVIADQAATREAIIEARPFLEQTDVHDVVVVFLAGHGLVSNDLDYYFATHDVDFEKPETRGLRYDEIEGLMDGIPARRKLLLIDACHSGEIEKEEVVLAVNESRNLKTRSFRGLKAKLKPKLGGEDLGELLQSLFADLRRGTGAAVITSSSGSEFSLEDERWKNGVFTYAVKEALASGKAGNPGGVTVSKLESYVSDRVSQLTQGKQNPTFRRKSMDNDFVVY